MLTIKQKLKKLMMSSVAVILVCALCIQMIPQGAVLTGSAEETAAKPRLDELLTVKQETDDPSHIISEEIESREPNVKHFKLANGNYIAAEYPTDIHYEKDGELVDIDNTLVYDSETNTYSPADSPIDVTFAASAQDDSKELNTFSVSNTSVTHTDTLVTYNSGGHALSSSLILREKETNAEVMSSSDDSEIQAIGAQITSELTEKVSDIAVTEPNLSLSVENAEPSGNIEGDDKFLVLDKLVSTASYDNILPNVGFEYVVTPDGVKENIILKNSSAQRKFRFAYDIGELTAVQENERTIVMKDADGKEIYRISAPLMNDSANARSTALTFTIVSNGNGMLVAELSADNAWLDDEARVYPVTLDPWTQTSQTKSGILKSGAYYQKNAVTDAPGSFHIGNCDDYGVCRSFIKFNLPDIGIGGMVVNAEFCALQYPENGYSTYFDGESLQVNIGEIEQISWGANRWTSFGTSPKIKTSEIADFVTTNASKNNTALRFNITRIAKNWYTGKSANNGLALWSKEEGKKKIAILVSGYSLYDNARPLFVVTYLNNKGLESRWTTHAHSAGTAGTGHVNDYTGNLVFVSPLTGTTGNMMPASLNLVYNGYQADSIAADKNGKTMTNVGSGWRLDMANLHVTSTDKSDFPYYYTDSDGTDHYFKKVDGKFQDEEGLGLTLTVGTSGYTIDSTDGTKLTFGDGGYISKITGPDGKISQIFAYSGVKFSSITDGSGRVMKAEYSGDRLAKLIDPSGRSINFTYSGNYLTRIEYPDGTSSSFTYYLSADSKIKDGRLKSAVSSDGSQIGYTYYAKVGMQDCEKYRVAGVTEYGAGGAEGNKLGFEYGDDNTTKFTDCTAGKSANYEVYQFDAVGRTVSVTDSLGGASSYTYASVSAADKVQNRLISASSTSKPVENLLKNHNFELENDTSWAFEGTGIKDLYRTDRYLGYYCARLSNGTVGNTKISQFIPAKAGSDLTFSAYIKTENIVPTDENSGLAMLIDFYGGGQKLGQTAYSQFITGTNGWSRYSFTATAPAGTTQARVYVLLKNAAGTAYIDMAQAEIGSGASQYNILENSSFTNGMTNWGGLNFESGDGIVNGKLRINGKAAAGKHVGQCVTVVRPASKCGISVSGKATGKSADIRDGRTFALAVKFAFSDGTFEEQLVPFNPDTYGEQFTSKAVYPSAANLGKTVSFINFYAEYYYNENSVEFDDLQLTFDESGTAYSYDSNGNLINAVDNGQRNSAYTFNNVNELTSATNPDNTRYTYKYDDTYKHRLISARSANSRLEYKFTYDESTGNVTKTEAYSTNENGYAPPDVRKMYTETAYTPDGNYVASQTDDKGNIVATNYYDNNNDPYVYAQKPILKGNLTKNVDGNGNVTEYGYNNKNDRLLETKAVDKNGSAELAKNAYTYTADGKLIGITAGVENTQSYSFEYDAFGNQKTVKVGGNNLITHEYGANNGNLMKSNYANGDWKSYIYDSYDRVIAETYKNDVMLRYRYFYNSEGQLSKVIDNESGLTYSYLYDILGRPLSCTCSNGTKISFAFDNFNKSTNKKYTWNGMTKTTAFAYDLSFDNALKTTTFSNGSTLENTYNGFGNVEYQTLKVGANSFTHYSNYTVNGTRASNQIARLYYKKNGDNLTALDYKYDKNGNITKIYDRPYTSNFPGANETPAVAYEYDQLNQLTHEINGYTGEEVSYTYDKRGNILSKTITKNGATNTINYTYGNENWKDLLTSYNGQEITYDAIGNPDIIDGWDFTWRKGRQLKDMRKGSDFVEFKYDSNGIRNRKTVNGVITEFLVDGSQVVAQKTGDNIVWFYYDGNGQLTAMQNGNNGEYYYYVHNLQGDIIALLDKDLNYVANYTYDSWGKLVSVTGSNLAIANLNPFRYRGYYYDSETELYYLNSRYYSPEMGRFINADGYVQTGQGLLDKNMFAYCMNNPVNMSDWSGRWSVFSPQIVLTVKNIVNTTVNVLSAKKDTKSSSSSSKNFANNVSRTHITTPTAMIDGGPLLGKVGFSTTTTYQNKEPGLLYSYSDIGNDASKYGVGIDAGGWLGLGAGASSNANIYVNAQVTPWVHGEVSLGLDGIGGVVGVDVGNTSYDFELKCGWGLIAIFTLGAAALAGGGKTAPAY